MKFRLYSFCHLYNCQHWKMLASLFLCHWEKNCLFNLHSISVFLASHLSFLEQWYIINSEILMFFTSLPFLWQFTCFLLSSFPSAYPREGHFSPTSLFHLSFKRLCGLLEEENVICCHRAWTVSFVILPEFPGSRLLSSVRGYWTWRRHVML